MAASLIFGNYEGFSPFFIRLVIDNNKAGNRIKLVHIATKSVIETMTPIAAVPPKLDAAKMANPQNKIAAV